MLKIVKYLRHSLISKLILTVGIVLLLSLSTWAYFNIKYQKQKVMGGVIEGAGRLTDTIRLGAHYAMMLNSRDDINQIINNISRQKEIENIRIYNKAGQITFSNRTAEVDRITNIKAEACDICHRSVPPLSELDLSKRIRVFDSSEGYRLLGVISPIYNEPSCATDACHVHPRDKKILGALDVVVSLQQTDQEIRHFEKGIMVFAVIVFVLISAMIFVSVLHFVNRPIQRLIDGTRRLAGGDYHSTVEVNQSDEMGQLALAINQMGCQIGENQQELNKQRNEYQNLFEMVPCIITVQDRDYKLVGYNREFSEKFDPQPGDFCYHAYKGRDCKCVVCPVEKTFEDGKSHFSEEIGFNRDGSAKHWIVRTSPLRNAQGEIVAAMEMGLDVTQRKQLEEELEKSEKKYYAIFNNIPNPVFVLDCDTLEILDCNESVKSVYGYAKTEIIKRSFVDLFAGQDPIPDAATFWQVDVINQVKQVNKAGEFLYVDIWISPSEYPGQKVLLVTTSDITKRLETEQHLLQACKMATMGEMATGVAHELNQPLAVIKTASRFLMRKVNAQEPIQDDILLTMAGEIDGHVDRAAKIINHMRQFGRKTELSLAPVRLNDIIKRAVEIFSQQLRVREIEVIWELEKDLPELLADPDRLEQVFINLLINARDALEEKSQFQVQRKFSKQIVLRTRSDDRRVIAEVSDTGQGISRKIADKIFEPFFTTKKIGKGTGLGLSISYGIVKDCKGSIQVQSQEGEGATFVLEFPVPETA